MLARSLPTTPCAPIPRPDLTGSLRFWTLTRYATYAILYRPDESPR
jgi:hypothetical protein